MDKLSDKLVSKMGIRGYPSDMDKGSHNLTSQERRWKTNLKQLNLLTVPRKIFVDSLLMELNIQRLRL